LSKKLAGHNLAQQKSPERQLQAAGNNLEHQKEAWMPIQKTQGGNNHKLTGNHFEQQKPPGCQLHAKFWPMS
jgi:hypothetical protein